MDWEDWEVERRTSAVPHDPILILILSFDVVPFPFVVVVAVPEEKEGEERGVREVMRILEASRFRIARPAL